MPARPNTPPPPPAVQRLTLRYAKRGRMRFASSRDIGRAVERAVRQAGLPVAFSAGFSPHPKISYSGGAPTGVASEAEYLDIALTAQCEPAQVAARISAALPDGLDVLDVVEPDAPGLAGKPGLVLEASAWEAIVPGVAVAQAEAMVAAFLAAPSAEVERRTSKGTRLVDARAAVAFLAAGPQEGPAEGGGAGGTAGCAILRMVVRHTTPAVRPDDVLGVLLGPGAVPGAGVPRPAGPGGPDRPLGSDQREGVAGPVPPIVTRLAQGPLAQVMQAAQASAGGCDQQPAGGVGHQDGRPAAGERYGRDVADEHDSRPVAAPQDSRAAAPQHGHLVAEEQHGRAAAGEHEESVTG